MTLGLLIAAFPPDATLNKTCQGFESWGAVKRKILLMCCFFSSIPQPDLPQRTSLVAETTTIEIHREDPEEELGMRIVGGKDTPLGNIVVQEVLRDSVIAADGRIAPGDHILEVGKPPWQPHCFP